MEHHGDDNVANSAIVTLRNLAEDIKNKEVIGQYGAKAISGKVKIRFIFLDFFKSFKTSYQQALSRPTRSRRR